MGRKAVLGQPNIGHIWLPETTVSYAQPGKCRAKYAGVVVGSQMRPRWSVDGLARLPELISPKPGEARAQIREIAAYIDPLKFACETIWASVTHNERVDMGSSIQHRICFGVVGQTTNGFFDDLAVGGVGAAPALTGVITKTKTDLSLGSGSADVTTNEQTTATLARGIAVHQNLGGAPGALDGTRTSDLYKQFLPTLTASVMSTGLFDSPTVVGSHLYVEDNFSAVASLINGDTLQVTWTITF